MPLQLSHTSTYAILSNTKPYTALIHQTYLYTYPFFNTFMPNSRSIPHLACSQEPAPQPSHPGGPTLTNPTWGRAARQLARSPVEEGVAGGGRSWTRAVAEGGTQRRLAHAGGWRRVWLLQTRPMLLKEESAHGCRSISSDAVQNLQGHLAPFQLPISFILLLPPRPPQQLSPVGSALLSLDC
jgi:hypothetical protein